MLACSGAAFEFDPLEASDPRIPEGFEVVSYRITIRERIPDRFTPPCTGMSTFIPVRGDGTIDPTFFNTHGKPAIRRCIFGGGTFATLASAQRRFAEALARAQAARGFAEVRVNLRPIN